MSAARTSGTATTQTVPRQAWTMLAVATVGFAVNFWAWALISPLGAFYSEALGLSAVQKSLLVAVPVVVGSLGRIPVGALTDRFGARTMFPLVSALTILPVLFIGYVASDSYALMLLGGLVLGLGGTTFAIGVPLVNAWFPPAKRGTALGVFGAGMGGTAISAFSTVQLRRSIGLEFPFTLVAVLLASYAVVAWLLLRDAPGRPVAAGGVLRRTWTRSGCPSRCRCPSSTPSASAASWPSACTCPRTCATPSAWTPVTPRCAPPASSCSR
jgi:MFS transporter, NNP family, nitrate/nitrite transporter